MDPPTLDMLMHGNLHYQYYLSSFVKHAEGGGGRASHVRGRGAVGRCESEGDEFGEWILCCDVVGPHGLHCSGARVNAAVHFELREASHACWLKELQACYRSLYRR
jgi:hypothetical protein